MNGKEYLIGVLAVVCVLAGCKRMGLKDTIPSLDNITACTEEPTDFSSEETIATTSTEVTVAVLTKSSADKLVEEQVTTPTETVDVPSISTELTQQETTKVTDGIELPDDVWN